LQGILLLFVDRKEFYFYFSASVGRTAYGFIEESTLFLFILEKPKNCGGAAARKNTILHA
jgi:hypothetical protein